MKFNVSREGGYLLAKVDGSIDSTTTRELHDRIQMLVQEDADILVDVSETDYINSDGLIEFLRLHQEVRKKSHRLVVFSPTPLVRSVFRAANLDTVFQVADSRREALEFVSVN